MIDFQLGFAPLLVLLFFLAFAAVKILREYERGVIFMLGRFWKGKGPGLIVVVPWLGHASWHAYRALVDAGTLPERLAPEGER